MLRGRGVVVLVCAIACAACATPFNRAIRDDPDAVVRAAAARTASGAATVDGYLTVHNENRTAFSGTVDFRRDRARVLNTTQLQTPTVQYETRYVDGWTYIELIPASKPPPTVRSDARWVAVHARLLHVSVPLPAITYVPGASAQLVAMLEHDSKQARRAGSAFGGIRLYTVAIPCDQCASRARRIEVGVDPDGYLVTIDSGTVDTYEASIRFHELPKSPHIAAPPESEVQRIGPSTNLYGPTPTTLPTA